MEDVFQRIAENLVNRLDGPLRFRFILQPMMALIFATLDGIKDAKLGKPAYFWNLIFNPGQRAEFLKHGWKSVGKIFILAVVLDFVYQLRVHHAIYPGEIFIVAFTLAIAPYLVMRGPINRIARLFIKETTYHA